MKKLIAYLIIFTLIILGGVLYISNKENEIIFKDKGINTESVKSKEIKNSKFQKALKLMNNEDYKVSVKMFISLEHELDTSDELYQDVIENIAIGYYHLNNYNESIKYFEMRELTDNIVLEKYLAGLYFPALVLNKDYLKVIEKGNEYVERFNDDEITRLVKEYQFNAYIGLENYDEALVINEKMKELHPNYVDYYIATAYLYQYSATEEELTLYLESAIQKFPDNKLIKSMLENYTKD